LPIAAASGITAIMVTSSAAVRNSSSSDWLARLLVAMANPAASETTPGLQPPGEQFATRA
jgi:hypothetical protein